MAHLGSMQLSPVSVQIPRNTPKHLPSLLPQTFNSGRIASAQGSSALRQKYLKHMNHKSIATQPHTAALLENQFRATTNTFRPTQRMNNSVHLTRLPGNDTLHDGFFQRKTVRFGVEPTYGINAFLNKDAVSHSRSKPNSRASSFNKHTHVRVAQFRKQPLWKPCGRSLQFTTAFHNNMFMDTTIQGATREKEKMSRTLQRMKAREAKKLHRLQILQHKLEIAEQLETELGEQEIERYNEIQLSKLLKRRYIRQTNEQAAILIQRKWKSYWAHKLFIKQEQRREEAARLIQEHWREYRDTILIPRERWKRQFKAVTLLQRYIRGYMVHKKVVKDLSDIKLNTCFDYFKRVRNSLLVTLQIKIRYHWKKYKRRKIIHRARIICSLLKVKTTFIRFIKAKRREKRLKAARIKREAERIASLPYWQRQRQLKRSRLKEQITISPQNSSRHSRATPLANQHSTPVPSFKPSSPSFFVQKAEQMTMKNENQILQKESLEMNSHEERRSTMPISDNSLNLLSPDKSGLPRLKTLEQSPLQTLSPPKEERIRRETVIPYPSKRQASPAPINRREVLPQIKTEEHTYSISEETSKVLDPFETKLIRHFLPEQDQFYLEGNTQTFNQIYSEVRHLYRENEDKAISGTTAYPLTILSNFVEDIVETQHNKHTYSSLMRELKLTQAERDAYEDYREQSEYPISLEEFIMEDRVQEENNAEYQQAFVKQYSQNFSSKRLDALLETGVLRREEGGTAKRMPSLETTLSRALRHSKRNLSIPDLREDNSWHQGYYKNFRREGLCKEVNNLLGPRMKIYGSEEGSLMWVQQKAALRLRRMSCG